MVANIVVVSLVWFYGISTSVDYPMLVLFIHYK